jgi:hypothetical protein
MPDGMGTQPGNRRITFHSGGRKPMLQQRYYKDGSTRPSRLRVNDFVAQHIQRQAAADHTRVQAV